jgi:hypothetical protein
VLPKWIKPAARVWNIRQHILQERKDAPSGSCSTSGFDASIQADTKGASDGETHIVDRGTRAE